MFEDDAVLELVKALIAQSRTRAAHDELGRGKVGGGGAGASGGAGRTASGGGGKGGGGGVPFNEMESMFFLELLCKVRRPLFFALLRCCFRQVMAIG